MSFADLQKSGGGRPLQARYVALWSRSPITNSENSFSAAAVALIRS